MNELILTLGLLAGPAALAFGLFACFVPSALKGAIFAEVSLVCLFFFVCVFRTLGAALGDKVGSVDYPSLPLYLCLGVLVGLPFAAIRFSARASLVQNS